MHDDRVLAELDVPERLEHLPGDATLGTGEVAVFLRTSVSALEAMRTHGMGPLCELLEQGNGTRCLYRKADLAAWYRQREAKSGIHPPPRHGDLLADISHLVNIEAFWIDQHGAVAGMVEAAPVSVAVARLGRFEIAWLTALDAASRPWADVAEHEAFAASIQRVLQDASERLAQAVTATRLSSPARVA